MPTLDSCINEIFEPGNIGSSPGTPPTVIVPGTVLDPGTYDPDAVIYSLDYSKFYNSMYLLLLMVGGGNATPGPGGGPPITDPPLISGPGNISLLLAEQQNNFGFSEALPKDLPEAYSWYNGYDGNGSDFAPSGFTAMTGYGVCYQMIGTDDATIPGVIEVRNMRSYVRLTADKSWVQIQDSTDLSGGHYVADFVGDAAIPMDVNNIGAFLWTMDGPPLGYNNHWFVNPRGEYTADTVDGAFCIFEIRVTDPAAADRLVALCGIDWWLDQDAAWMPDFSTNPGAGGSNWITLTTTFKPVCCVSVTNAVLEESLPPPVIA